MSFLIRKLNDAETLGQKLRALRLSANRTLSEMAAVSKIRRGHLEAFEQDRHDALPPPIYARQFLKAYVQALGGEVGYFLDRYDAERGTCDFTHATRLPPLRRRAAEFLVTSKFLRAAALGSIVLCLATYLGQQLVDIVAPPEITVSFPANGWTTNDATIEVRGSAEQETTIQVNGEPVLLKPDGTFTANVALERGVNLITVSGTKRYSRSQTEERRILLEGTNGISISNQPSPLGP